MRISNDVKTISSSLSFLGLDGMAGRMESDIRQTASTADTTGVIAASFSMYACEVKATRAAKCLKHSRLPEEILFSDFLMVGDRSLSQLTIVGDGTKTPTEDDTKNQKQAGTISQTNIEQ